MVAIALVAAWHPACTFAACAPVSVGVVVGAVRSTVLVTTTGADSGLTLPARSRATTVSVCCPAGISRSRRTHVPSSIGAVWLIRTPSR